MPSTSKSIAEIKKTNSNLKSNNNFYDAVVLANYGDPGLEEDYHADILSRYVICMLESANRTLTYDRWKTMIVIVKRPEHLWIKYEGGFVNDINSQKRSDASLNVNVGPAGAYTVNSISKINYPYQLGEKIRIKAIEKQTTFSSECPNDINSFYYGTWHTQGASLIDYTTNASLKIREKTIAASNVGNNYYNFFFNKWHYEAMALSLYNSEKLKRLFKGESFDSFYYQGNGGYLFYNNLSSTPLNIIEYEDVNVGGKYRIASNSCIPLVVTTPNSFTVPQTRAIGTVNYSPTYVPKNV